MNARTLNDVNDEIRSRQDRCSDYKVNSGSLSWRVPDALDFPVQGGFAQSAALNDRAFQQTCERFNVPARWAMDPEDCPNALRQLVFNYKFHNTAPKDMLLRAITQGEGEAETLTLRAMLSDRYQPYDHADLWGAVMAACSTMPMEPKVILKGGVQDELRGYLLFDSIQFDADLPHRPQGGIGPLRPARPGTQDGGGSGGLHPAVYFGNSETGFGRVRIAAGLFRSFCSNGTIYGWKEQGAIAITHLWSQKRHIALAVNEGITNALTLSEEAATKMLEAMDKPLVMESDEAKAKLFDKWADKYGLLVESKDAWAALVRPGASVFDFVNAATMVARDSNDGEQAEVMSRMAGDLLASL